MLTTEQRTHLDQCCFWIGEEHRWSQAIRAALDTIDQQDAELGLLRRVVRGFDPVAMVMEPDDEAYWLDADGLAALREWRERHGGQAK